MSDGHPILKNRPMKTSGRTAVPAEPAERAVPSELFPEIENDALFRLCFEKSPDAHFLFRDERVICCNEAASAMFGCVRREEMLDRAPFSFSPRCQPDGRSSEEAGRERIAEALERGTLHFEWTHRRRDGTDFPAEVVLTVLSREKRGFILAEIRDISERLRVEEAIRESERNLLDIVDLLPDPTFVIDRNGVVVAWNRAIAALSGIASRDMLGKGDHEYALPFYGKRRPILIDLVLKPEDRWGEKYRGLVRHEDGRLVGESYMPNLRGGGMYLLGTAAPLYDAQGDIKGAIETIHDLTERRQIERALQESEEKYRTILEAVDEVYFEVDLAGNLTFFNRILPEYVGYTEEELKGANYRMFLGEETAPKVFPIFNRVFRTGVPERASEWVMKRRGGQTFIVEVAVFLKTDARGNPNGFRGTARDISERKRVEGELRESEERYRTLAERSFAGVYVVQDGIFRYLNRTAASYAGYRPEELVNTDALELILPEDRERSRQFAADMLKGVRLSPYEFRILTKTGKIRWIMETVTPIRFHGRPAILGNSMDVSERKEVEAQLRYLSTHDVLTKLYNRAYFEEELNRLQRGRSFPVSIIVADLDGLKKVNDSQGHAAGDDLLRRAAQVLQGSLRAEDVLARIGGDEFAALLPATDHGVASSVVVRIRKNVKDHNRVHAKSPLSISVGLDTGTRESDLNQIMQAADRFMYMEKSRKKAANPLVRGVGDHDAG
jgi:diguanylate cyclase (GGDEF)-like protein/PAS domain S-box-containing protein